VRSPDENDRLFKHENVAWQTFENENAITISPIMERETPDIFFVSIALPSVSETSLVLRLGARWLRLY
jgi:hypothetical protein